MDNNKRSAGVLLPISSLPSKYGIGSLGKAAFSFVDFLYESGLKLWQLLPLNVTSYGDSPYQSPSSNGLNYYFIDLDLLVEDGLLKSDEISSFDFGSDPRRVDYGKLFSNRLTLLNQAYKRFLSLDQSEFELFKERGEYNDFAFYMTLKAKYNFAPWYNWPKDVQRYSEELETKVKESEEGLYDFFLWTQYTFLKQYKALKDYANKKGIRIIGDMPLYLAYDSLEAYKYPELFHFDENHQPLIVAGCPPDYFSADGQLWGNPIYNWEKMKADGYEWFSKRIARNLEIYDILRIDHFRGFSSYYAIPFGSENARNGKWIKGPGFDLFKDKLNLDIIAEDLGTLDDGVYDLLKKTGYPGMKVLEFAFDGDPQNSHKPSNSTLNSISYTGTHDNSTLKGHLISLNAEQLIAFKTDLKQECERFNVSYDDSTIDNLIWTVDKLCLSSPSFASIIPLQDFLFLDDQARINLPSSLSSKNWTYRFLPGDFSSELSMKIKNELVKSKRL